MNYTDEYLNHLFGYHPADAIQIVKCNNMRNSAAEFARVVIANTPDCSGRDKAIEFIQIALLIANRAVSTHNENEIPMPIGHNQDPISNGINNYFEASSK